MGKLSILMITTVNVTIFFYFWRCRNYKNCYPDDNRQEPAKFSAENFDRLPDTIDMRDWENEFYDPLEKMEDKVALPHNKVVRTFSGTRICRYADQGPEWLQ